jgi:hypothetical protein
MVVMVACTHPLSVLFSLLTPTGRAYYLPGHPPTHTSLTHTRMYASSPVRCMGEFTFP